MFTGDCGLLEEDPVTSDRKEWRPVTCPSRTRCRPVIEFLGGLSHARVEHGRDVALRTATRLRQDDAWAQFVRFLVVGATSTALYAVLFLFLRHFGYLPAHVVATVASSMLANELHRRLTFRAEGRVSWLTAQVEAGGVSFVGLMATTIALGWLDALAGSASPFWQITLVATVTAVIGLLRFLALRWIFGPAVPSTA
jgi:putative flippase GtrA